MGITIAIAGKGGTGKTTLTSLLIRYFKFLKKGVVLAVDADPNSCLYEKLGVQVEQTIGSLREDILKDADNIPGGMSKPEYVDYQLRGALAEEEHFDLIAMGRQEGPGCYCYINNILRTVIDAFSDKYNYVIIDNEAGMEHLSRRTTRAMDVLLICSDATKIGVETAGRIDKLAQEMEIKIKNTHLVINRAPSGELPDLLIQIIKDQGFENYMLIPDDPLINQYNLEGKPLLDLPEDSIAVKAVNEIGDMILGK